jgi:hypothetical protein
VSAALDQNALVVIGVLIVLTLAAPGVRRTAVWLLQLPGALGWSMALAVAWAVVRNLPIVPYLSSGLGA